MALQLSAHPPTGASRLRAAPQTQLVLLKAHSRAGVTKVWRVCPQHKWCGNIARSDLDSAPARPDEKLKDIERSQCWDITPLPRICTTQHNCIAFWGSIAQYQAGTVTTRGKDWHAGACAGE